VIDGPPAIAAEDAGGVSIVDHHDGTVFFSEIGQFVDGADVSVHGKDAVGDEELLAGLVLDLLQELFGVGDILVAEDLDFGLRETGAVDDAGVVEFVGENEILFAEDAGDGAGIGREAGLEDDAGLDAFEGCDLFFQLHVDVHGACDGADGSGAYSVFFCGSDGGLFEARIVAEAEVVVGREVDDALAVVGADGGLLVVEHTQLEECSLYTQGVELGSEMGKLRAFGGCGGHRNYLKPFRAGRSLRRNEHLTELVELDRF